MDALARAAGPPGGHPQLGAGFKKGRGHIPTPPRSVFTAFFQREACAFHEGAKLEVNPIVPLWLMPKKRTDEDEEEWEEEEDWEEDFDSGDEEE